MVGRHKTREPEWSTQMREIAVNEHKLSPDPQWNNQETIKNMLAN